MISLPAIIQARRDVATPILSSNLCCAWWLMRQTGVHAPSVRFAAASPELTALLPPWHRGADAPA